jgi:hypothetical protein
MKKILLHVGTHKTGSTSIQQTLFNNREILRANNIHYLEFGSNHWHIYSAFMNKPWDWFEHRRMGRDKAGVEEMNAATIRDVEAEIKSSECDNILISSEYLAQLPKRKIYNLRTYLQAMGEVTVVYYCRELISWISSDSQQCAKVGMKNEPTKYDVAIKRLYDFPLNYIEVFGVKNFRLVRFEDAVQRGLCNSLLSQGNLATVEKMGISETSENTSISAEAVNAFFILNKIHPLFGETRSQDTTQLLKAMPGRKYQVNLLTKEQAADCNKKMRYLRRKYKFPMYDKVRPPVGQSDRQIFGDESMTYLLDHLNNTSLRHQALLQRVRALKKEANSSIEEGKEAEARGDTAAAAELYRKALEPLAGLRLWKFKQ